MKKIIIISSLIILFLVGCNDVEKEKAKLLQKTLDEGNYVVLDVRTKEEYDEGHVKEAINIPYDEIDENVNLDKDKTILVYCRSGKRSNIAYKTLKNMGYKVIDLGAYDKVTLEKE